MALVWIPATRVCCDVECWISERLVIGRAGVAEGPQVEFELGRLCRI